MLERLISYLKQPSTYKGLAKLAAAGGFVGFPELFPLIIVALVLVDGLVDTFRNETPKDPREAARLKLEQARAKARQLGVE